MDDRTGQLLTTLHAGLLLALRGARDPSLRAALIMALGAIEDVLGLPRTLPSRKDRRAERPFS